MFCTKCGTQAIEEAAFCAECGNPIRQSRKQTPSATVNQKSSMPTVGSTVSFANIDWRVLEVQGSNALLITDKVIEKGSYNSELEDKTWENCTLRQYLNSVFYNRLGTGMSRVIETQIKNNDNPWYGTNGGNNTSDKVFLLSIDEVIRYFGDSGQLNNRPVYSDGDAAAYIFDEFSSARVAYDTRGIASWWWLRSPGESSIQAAVISSEGDFSICGDYLPYGDGNANIIGLDENDNEVAPGSGGIRPVIWLNYSETVSNTPVQQAVKEQSNTSNFSSANGVISGTPKIGSIIPFANLNWRVLDTQGSKTLLITDKTISNSRYHDEFDDVTWQFCALRKYLNNEFYNSLGDAKTHILLTRNSNFGNPCYKSPDNNETDDKVFLLSLDEVIKYFGDSGSIKYIKGEIIDGGPDEILNLNDCYNSARIAKNDSGENGTWWLRSSGFNTRSAMYVDNSGCIELTGAPVFDFSMSGRTITAIFGVRPAIWIDNSALSAGTESPTSQKISKTQQKQKRNQVRVSDIIDGVLSSGMAKYNANQGRGGDPTQYWDAETKFVLGYSVLSGASPGDDIGFEIHLITQSAEAGFMLAQFVLGNCYAEGFGVNRDRSKAEYWWQKAAEQGLEDAQEKLPMNHSAEQKRTDSTTKTNSHKKRKNKPNKIENEKDSNMSDYDSLIAATKNLANGLPPDLKEMTLSDLRDAESGRIAAMKVLASTFGIVADNYTGNQDMKDAIRFVSNQWSRLADIAENS